MQGAATQSLSGAENEDGRRLSALLKQSRLRINAQSAALGDFSRLPSRIGRPVTQEELAEAAGITRQYYGGMESGRQRRASSRALSRIADVLMMDREERVALFELVLPEIQTHSPTQHANEVFDHFGSFHRFTRSLWAASSEREVCMAVIEFAKRELDADVVLTRSRIGEGRWELAGSGKRFDFDLMKQAEAAVQERWGSSAIDDLMCHTTMVAPGEVLTMSERDARFPALAVKRRAALEVLGWTEVSSAMASIQSQSGFVARLSIVHTSAHEYSHIEREQLSTLAELASLALFG